MRYDSILSGYTRFSFRHGLWTRRVYRRGVGPVVIIIHEMPGLHPLVVRFADRVALAGMTVFCPSLCGVAGRPADHPLSRFTILYGVCVRREFNSWAAGRSSPIVDWLRALARRAFQECGGRGVGAVGMCFTGGFALAMMTEPSVVAPVLSQPSLPLAGKNSPKASGIDASSERSLVPNGGSETRTFPWLDCGSSATLSFLTADSRHIGGNSVNTLKRLNSTQKRLHQAVSSDRIQCSRSISGTKAPRRPPNSA